MEDYRFMEKRVMECSFGSQSDSEKAYREECKRMTALERLACIQKLRVAFWGDEASTGRLSRVPELIKRATG